jgi:hypothetical protein
MFFIPTRNNVNTEIQSLLNNFAQNTNVSNTALDSLLKNPLFTARIESIAHYTTVNILATFCDRVGTSLDNSLQQNKTYLNQFFTHRVLGDTIQQDVEHLCKFFAPILNENVHGKNLPEYIRSIANDCIESHIYTATETINRKVGESLADIDFSNKLNDSLAETRQRVKMLEERLDAQNKPSTIGCIAVLTACVIGIKMIF